MKHSPTTRRIVRGGLIAAAYAVLCMAFFTFSYGDVQFRISEALTVLPLLMPEAVPGLFVGCLLSNLLGGMGILDIVFGSLATLLAALLTRLMRRLPKAIAVLPVVLVNAFVIGGVVLHLGAGLPLWLSIGSVGLGQLTVVYLLGLPLYAALNRMLPQKYRG